MPCKGPRQLPVRRQAFGFGRALLLSPVTLDCSETGSSDYCCANTRLALAHHALEQLRLKQAVEVCIRGGEVNPKLAGGRADIRIGECGLFRIRPADFTVNYCRIQQGRDGGSGSD